MCGRSTITVWHLNYKIRYVLAFLVKKKNCRKTSDSIIYNLQMILKIGFWLKYDNCFPVMSSDNLVYYLTLRPSALFRRIINVYMTTLSTRRIIIVLSKLKIKIFLQQRYSLNYRARNFTHVENTYIPASFYWKGMFGYHGTNLSQTHLSEVHILSLESKCLRVCLLGVYILLLSLQFFVEIKTGSYLWFFIFLFL